MPIVQLYFSIYTILLKLFGVHCPSPLDSKLLEEVLLLQVWIHFMCSEKLVELITTLRNSYLGDLRESGMVKIHKCWLLFTFDFFCSHVLWIFLNYLKGHFRFWKMVKILLNMIKKFWDLNDAVKGGCRGRLE